jgi:uncharacterized protein (TIGR03067 family)
MKPALSSLIWIAFVFPGHLVYGDEKESQPTDYQKAIRGLRANKIYAGLSSDKLLDLCIPTAKRTLGRFTEYEFQLLPGYHGLSIIAKNGVLQRAVEWSCTYSRTYFDELTADDEKLYQKLRRENEDVPFERFIGRWGWERPRMRDWKRDEAEPPGAAKDELRGRWNVLAWDENGTWLSAPEGDEGAFHRDMVVQFTDDRMIIKPRNRDGWPFFFGVTLTWESAYRINPAKHPKEFDWIVMEWRGKVGRLTDKVRPGIYALSGDMLTICYDYSKVPRRPTKFAIAEGRSHVILLLQRDKEDKQRGK